MEQDNYNQLKDRALGWGISLFGVASLDNLKQNIAGILPETLQDLFFAVSLGVRLSDKIIDDIKGKPTQLYLHHYRQVNYLLDKVAFLISNFIQEQGYQALPIAASQVIDWQNQKGHLSHKHVACEAGLGWMGKNNLLVTPKWGARVRLVSILTNFPLVVDKKLNVNCGSCKRCLTVCPAGAIREKREDFDHLACFEQLKQFKREYNIAHYICGICVKSCRPLN
ncbi:epoxyqueuosine reductase [Candidatus Aerophobetes bacterium]|nr:epoxyqueuosine reductase [Candidatus Aerophobetes bacterium]